MPSPKINSNESYSFSEISEKVISSLAKNDPDWRKLVEVKSKRGVPLPILISLEIPQLAEL